MSARSKGYTGLPGWLLLLGALTAVAPLSIDMYLPAFPQMARYLHTDAAHVQLTLAVFLAGLALGQLVYGPLSDRFGRKPPLYVGLALYVIASVGCVIAGSVNQLIVWRFIQALGCGAGLVVTRAVIRDRTTTLEGARAFSMLMLVMGLAPILAPLLGSGVLIFTDWRGIFVSLAVFAGLLLLGVHYLMTETVSRHGKPPLRIGAVLRRYVELFKDKRFVTYTFCGGLAFSGMFAYIAGSPYVLIDVYGVSQEHFGWLFGINAAGLIGASQINGRLVSRFELDTILRRALWVPPISALVAIAAELLGFRSLVILMLGFFGYISALGFIGPNSSALALADQREHAGAASALMGTLQFLLGTLAGICVSIWHEPTALPLAGIMFACATLGGVVYTQCPPTLLRRGMEARK